MGRYTADDVIRALDYAPSTGLLTWRERPVDDFASERQWRFWNSKYAGSPAITCTDQRGYKSGKFMGSYLSAHRAAVMIMTGADLDGEIDHINGRRSDNMWANLRVVSGAQNMKNKKAYKSNKSGYVGVFWDAKSNKWRAKLGAVVIGLFADMADAILARALALELDGGYTVRHGKVKG